MFAFLDLKFIPVEISQKATIEPILKKYPQPLSSYTFASLISWGTVYSYSYVMIEETLIILGYKENKSFLLQPVGKFPKEVQNKLLEAIQKEPIEIMAVSDHFLIRYSEFCSHFHSVFQRGFANYLYKTADLANLAGRNYEKKRNLISQANRYQWQIEAINENSDFKALEILSKKEEENEELKDEFKALKTCFENFNLLDLKGLIIKIEGQIAAFSIFNTLNSNTAVIYFEKGNKNYKGIYQLINKETAKELLISGFEWINREEDLDIPGLRQAKMSYFPVDLVSSYNLKIKN